MHALHNLTEINLDDLVNAFGWQNRPVLRQVARVAFSGTARRFARQMLAFDALIRSRGLAEAACLTERLYVRDVRLYGAANLPDGPSLILSNHPGVTDALALFAALGRPGMKVIALDRPFLLSLPNLSQQTLFVSDDPSGRVSLVRRVYRHLRAGGSILTFPSGHTEPDPVNYPGALESLDSWTDSVGVFVRMAPETAVVPVCIRGVTWDWAVNHPLARRRKEPLDHMLLATMFQLIASVALGMRPVTVQIQVGTPIYAQDLGTTDAAVLHRAVLDSMRRLIENPPQGQGISAL